MSQQINLINPDFVEKEPAFSFRSMVMWCAGLLFCLLAYDVLSHYQADALGRRAREADQALKARQAQLIGLSASYKPRRKDPGLEAEVTRFEQNLKAHSDALAILKGGSLDSIRGYSGYMKAFARQIVPGLWLTGFSIQGREMSLQGRTLRPGLVPAYINRLDKEEVMRGITFASFEMHVPEKAKDADYLEFVLQSGDAK